MDKVKQDLRDLREELLDASLIIDNQELVKGYGHVSARIPGTDTMLMTPRRGPGLLEDPDEMIVLDFHGKLLEGDGPVAIEAVMHGAIYVARPDVSGLVRTHSKYSNVLSILGKPHRAVHGFGTFLGMEVPVFQKPFLITDEQLASELVAVLGNAEAVLIRGNGNIIVGRTVPEATVKAIFLEEACELHYLALCAGQPIHYTADELAVRSDPGYDHFGRAWEYYRERLYMDLESED
jgi:ribulose-5-phosphate 4-epimerase/fuculose-1-phosphate aldolase